MADDDLLWRLAYHIGGLTFLAAIRTAALQTVDEHDATVLNLELGQQTLWFSEGEYTWVARWSVRDSEHQYQSVDEYFREHTLNAQTAEDEPFAQTAEDEPFAQTGQDEHFAERQFVEQVFVPFFGLHGLKQLRPQVAFTDTAGKLPHIDFVLDGTRRYAIEIEGATYHEQPNNFSDEKLRQRSLVHAGYHYYPFAWTDIEAGHAQQDLMEELTKIDPLLKRLRQSRHRQSTVPLHLEPLLTDLPQRFPAMQCLVLDVLCQATGRSRLTLVDYQPHVATFTLAVLDTVALVERVAALYGLDVRLPEIDLHIVGPVP
ncbi:MAG: hypothetical protein WCG26_15205, partial [Chloroflexales bacterium]